MRCKVFRNYSSEIETEINNWLKTDNYEIFHITQVEKGDLIVTTIFYYTEKEFRKKKLNRLKDYDTED